MDKYLWNHAPKEKAVLILAHGAGAPMDHAFMSEVAQLFVKQDISVVRFEFPYMQERRLSGKKRPPDRAPKLLNCWREVVAEIQQTVQDVPLYIGGKSMGGRMATLLAAEGITGVSGVVCLGYPFYGPGKQDKPRIEHFGDMALPVLIVQGERDTMGSREQVTQYALSGLVSVQWLKDGNHDLKPRKVSGLTHDQHLQSAVKISTAFMLKAHRTSLPVGETSAGFD